MAFAAGLWPGWVTGDVPDRVEVAWANWVQAAGAERAVLALMRDGALVAQFAHGMDPGAPVELASLSKAVTAVCLDAMIGEGGIGYDTRLGEALGQAAPEVTLGQLVTHSAGIMPDSTQRSMWWWLGKPEPRHGEVTDRVLARQADAPGVFAYNNENYAVLGEVIARQSGRSYEGYCREAVLAPLGISSAELSPRTGAFGPWGGWTMSAEDYATFHWAAFGPESAIGQAPEAFPNVEVGGGASYGMGMIQRPFRDGHNFWHFGGLCFVFGPNLGAFAVIWEGEWSLTAAFDVCADDGQMRALDSALAEAVLAR